MSHAGHWARAAAGALALGRLLPAAGWAALAAAVITALMVRWVLSSQERTDRARELVSAFRGQAVTAPAAPPSLPAGRSSRPQRKRRNRSVAAGGEGRD